MLATLGLPPHAFAIDGVESHGGIGFSRRASRWPTASRRFRPPTPRKSSRTKAAWAWATCCNRRAGVLTGILNGIDEDAVESGDRRASRVALHARRDSTQRAANKAAVQARFGLDADPDALLVGVVSRLTWQKGMDLLLDALPALLRGGAQLALLGSGDQTSSAGSRRLRARSRPRRRA